MEYRDSPATADEFRERSVEDAIVQAGYSRYYFVQGQENATHDHTA